MPHFMQNLLIPVLMSLKYLEDGRLRNNTKRVDLLVFKTAFFFKYVKHDTLTFQWENANTQLLMGSTCNT